MDSELENIWKKAIMTKLKYYPRIYLEGLRKTMNTLSQDSQCLSWDSNLAPPEYI
jgi:hypothetical protein